MKRRLIGGSIAGAATLLLVVALASAANRFPTTIHYIDAGGPQPNNVAYGYITSPSHRCLANRTVKVYAVFGDGSKRLEDTDTTSSSGDWATRGDASGATGEQAKVLRKVVRRHHHVRRVCKADSVFVS